MPASKASKPSILTRSCLYREWVPLVLLIALAAFLRFWRIGQASLWQDELIWAQWSAQQTALGVVKSLIYPHSPFFALLNYFIHNYLHNVLFSDTYARFLPAVLGTLTIPALYLLGKRLFSSLVGFIAAFILCVCPIHVSFSRQLEPYSLQLLCLTLFALSLWSAWRGHRNSMWVLVTLFAAASIYAHMLSFFAIVILTTVLLLEWLLTPSRSWRRLVPLAVSLAVAAIAYTPWICLHVHTFAIKTDFFATYIPECGLSSPGGLLLLAGMFWREHTGLDSMFPPWAAIAGLIACVMAGRSAAANWRSFLFATSLLLTIPIVFLLLWYCGYYLRGHYFMSALTSVALLGGLAFQRVSLAWKSRRRPSSLATAIVGALCLGMLLIWNTSALGEIYTVQAHQDFRGLMALMQRHVQPGDAVFTTAWAPQHLFERYAPHLTHGTDRIWDHNWTQVEDALLKNKRVWLVAAWDLSPKQRDWLESGKYPHIFLQTGTPAARLWLFLPNKRRAGAPLIDLKRRLLKDAVQNAPGTKSGLYMQLASLAEQTPEPGIPPLFYWAEALRLLVREGRISHFSQRVHEQRAICYEHLHSYLAAANEYRFLRATSLRKTARWLECERRCLQRQAEAYESLGMTDAALSMSEAIGRIGRIK